MSAADFLLSPTVQKLLQVLYAAPDAPVPVDELARRAKLAAPEAEGTLEHLVASGMLSKQPAADEAPATVQLNRSFVFYRELRAIALKSFAAAEPIRAMLRAKFKHAVVRAFVLGEDAQGVVEVLVVHGELMPDEAAMAEACRKLSKTLHRHLQVHVISGARFERLAPGEALAAKLASASALEIIAPGDTRARPGSERTGLLHSARKKLAALARGRAKPH